MARRIRFTTLLITIGFLAGLVLTGRLRTAEESAAAEQPAATMQAPPQGTAARPVVTAPPAVLPDLTAVAQRVVGSVTNISSTQVVRGSNSPFENDPFFRYFFGDDDPFGNRERRAQSLGSGVIVSADGYVLTNNHVIGDVNAQVTVVLGDKRELPAKVVGVDEWTDIAVLKVDAKNLPVLPWGDSSKLKVAEWVLAIGNPFQLNQTVTLGIVSATGRSLEGRLATYEDFIQTDAAINPGNSGGALINARGELVGINTAIYSESGGYQGIGFAVPSNLAQHVMDDLIKFGEVRRGTIPGIKVQPLTTPIAQQLGAQNARGALVSSVDRRSDAYRSGLLPGDIIVGFNGATIEDTSQFIRLLSDAPIGTTVKLGLLRQGKASTVEVAVTQATGALATNRPRR
ncbi:MAG: trypsin-like peptidase domain-containing protein [Vicinamibacterales bacterium]